MIVGLHLDTHVVVWLYAGRDDLLPARLVERLEAEPLGFSPMVRLELTYLFELGRISVPGHLILGELAGALALTEDATPFGEVIDVAEGVRFTRDPFDRLITVRAIAARRELVTRDRTIRAAYPDASFWD